MRPQTILRAGAAIAPCALLAGVATAFAAGPKPAHPAAGPTTGRSAAVATAAAARPAAGDVAIARRRLNVVSGRRALVSGRVSGTPAGRAVALQLSLIHI